MFGGAFNAAANWSGGVPGNADVAEFGVATLFTPGTYTVSFDVNPTNQAIHVEDDIVTFDLNGRTYTTTLFVGNEIGNRAGSTGKLTITDGTWHVDTTLDAVYIGAVAGASGSLTVATGGQLTGSPQVFVGLLGTGSLAVQNGGDIFADFVSIGQQTAAIGTADVTGAGSTLNSTDTSVGQFGTGTLNIIAGGTVQSSLAASLGRFAGATGTAHVEGADSRWIDSGPLEVGRGGSGNLFISSAGRLDSTDGYIAVEAGSTGQATVAGANSLWINTGELTIGQDGDGTLDVTAGGRVQNTNGYIGRSSDGSGGGSGAVTVHGDGSLWTNTSVLYVGYDSAGSLNVEAGGDVTSVSGAVGYLPGSQGTATVDGPGSTWTTSGNLGVGDGTLTISNGAVVTTNGLFGTLADAATSDAQVNVVGQGSMWNLTNALLAVGDDGTAAMNILDGGNVSDLDAEIGADAGSSGTVLVSGNGATWTSAHDLRVGTSGTGALTIAEGGSVTNRDGYVGREAGSSGTVVVTGDDSAWTNNGLAVGYSGTGTLTIADGGSVAVNSFGFVGTFENSSGEVAVSGAGSTWSNGVFLAVGHFGDGTLTIDAGGTVACPRGFIGSRNSGAGEVTITGAGSAWNTTEVFVVGFEGIAELSVQDGGDISSNDAWIAGATTSTATVTVSGAGSNWTIAGRLAVSDAFDPVELGPGGGNGTLNIQSDASVNVGGDTALFPGATLNLQGGTLDTASVSFNGGGAFNFVDGTLHVGTFGGNLVNQGGTVAPGHSAGTTTITGSYAQQPAAKLEIEIGGTAAGTFDVVNIGTNASISGQLQLALIDGFEPAAGDAFIVLTTASGISGTFANVGNGQRLTTLDSLGSFLVHYGPESAFDSDQIVLSAFEPVALPGDFNFDGRVDAADYSVWRDGLGSSYTMAGYDIWKAHFGESLGNGAAAQVAVPEPAASTLLTASLLLAGIARTMARRIADW